MKKLKFLFTFLFLLQTSLSFASGYITDTDLFTSDGQNIYPKYKQVIYGGSLNLNVGVTPIINGTNGQCLSISAGILGNMACSTGTLTVGTSVISSGTSGYLLYDNAGVLGNLNPAGLTLAWSQITSTPTTIAGYGITDAFNSSVPTPIGATTPNTLAATTGSFNSTLTAYRYVASGTTLTSGDFSLIAGGGGSWGGGSSVGSISGTDSGFTATVTTAGSPTANPILTLTFKNGGWPPASFANCGAWVTGTTLVSDIANTTTTTLAMQFIGTPVTSTSYIITCSWIHD
jgi:hypothetical protein